MVDDVNFTEPWVNDLLRSLSMSVQFFDVDGLSVTDGINRITLPRLTQMVKESRGAIQGQTSIAFNQQCNPLPTQVYPNRYNYSSSTNMVHQSQIGFKQQQHYSSIQQSQYSQNAGMSVQGTEIAPSNQMNAGNCVSNAASVRQYVTTNVNQPTNYIQRHGSQSVTRSVQPQYGNGTFMQQQHQSSQGGTMSGLRPENAPYGMNHFGPH